MTTIPPPNGSEGREGYNYQFVKAPPDTLICAVCHLPSKEPHLSGCCGYTFCKSCLEGSKKSSNVCPQCSSEEFTTFFNKQADRVIQSLHVFCTNKEQGCEWQDEVNNITSHLGTDCLFEVVCCPNDCGESLQRQYLTSHVETECPRRRVNCQYCNDEGEYQFIEGQHKEECPKFPIQCPNKCEIKSIFRDEIEEHRGICPLEIIQCDYHIIGCKAKMARKDIHTHKQETMEKHLSLSINELMETKKQLKLTQNDEIEKPTKDDLTQQLVAKLADTEQQLTASQQEAKWTKNELLQKLTAIEKELNTTKQQLATTYTGCQNLEKEHTPLAASTDKALTEMETKFQDAVKRIAELETKLQQRTVRIEEIIHNHWLTFLRHQASRLMSGTEVIPIVVKMTEFAKNKASSWSSKPFNDNFSKDNCELYLQVSPSKIRNSLMSVSLLSRIPSKRVTGTFVVRLLNQISDSEHYLGPEDTSSPTKKSFSTNVVLQNDGFISYQELHKNTATCQFLKDDALFFEVVKNHN